MAKRHPTAARWLLLSIVATTAAVAALAQERRPPPRAGEMAAPSRPATAAQVEAAITKAKQFLYDRQRNGNWEESQTKQPTGRGGGGPGGPGDPMGARGADPVVSSQWGGLSSIATFALLAAGDRETDPRLAKSITFLKNADVTGTYALGLHAQIWNLIPSARQKDYKATVKKDAAVLLKGLRGTGDARGLYHYTPDDAGWDNSCAQFGVLGMWACAQTGQEVPSRYWKEVEDAWLNHQDRSGGWTYGGGGGGGGQGMSPAGPEGGPPGGGRPGGGPPGGGPPGGGRPGGPPMRPGEGPPGGGGPGGPPDSNRVTLSMTAAGVATLFITQDYLHSDTGLSCKGNYRNPAIEAGLKWTEEHYNQLADDRHFYYTLFGISRIGQSSGYKYLGVTDWYKDGAARLVNAQRANGSWDDSVSDTAFALLFLARGRAPLVLSKLEYALDQHGDAPRPANWNQRPRDAAGITQWLGRAMERGLNWQIVNLSADPADLHDAPILYLAGNQPLAFTPAEEAKLRAYVEQGGLILGNADCASKAFADSFRKLGRKLFDRYEFRDLPADHPIHREGFALPTPRPVRVQGLSNGCRELMLLIPDADPARFWQTRAYAAHEEQFNVLANVYLYAVDKAGLRHKGETYIVQPAPAVTAKKTLKVARLNLGDNPDPEPGGWRRLAAVLHNRQSIDLTTQTVSLGKNELSGFAVAHWTGTTAFKLTDAQRAELKAFAAGGGTLVIDAAGGSSEFAAAAEEELFAMFGDGAKSIRQPLPPDHPLFAAAAAAGGGGKAIAIDYRKHARRTLVGELQTPRLRGIEINGRLAVLFSAEDLSVGLVGQSVDGIYGYDPQTATRIMTCILESAATTNK